MSIVYKEQGTNESDLSMTAFDGSDKVGEIECKVREDEKGVKYLEINSLGVIDKYKRKGIGNNLLEKSIKHAKESGAKYASLLVKPNNTAATSLYKKLGFVKQTEIYNNMLYYKKEPL